MNLEECREKIDEIDAMLMILLGQRMDVSNEIAKIKKGQNLPVLDEKREEEVLAHAKNMGLEYGVKAEEAEAFMKTLMDLSKKRQNS